VFQAQTATGKLNAEMIPTTPIGGIAHTYGDRRSGVHSQSM
jgi:hypothetical protein